jgi:hypothetical protein
MNLPLLAVIFVMLNLLLESFLDNNMVVLPQFE